MAEVQSQKLKNQKKSKSSTWFSAAANVPQTCHFLIRKLFILLLSFPFHVISPSFFASNTTRLSTLWDFLLFVWRLKKKLSNLYIHFAHEFFTAFWVRWRKSFVSCKRMKISQNCGHATCWWGCGIIYKAKLKGKFLRNDWRNGCKFVMQGWNLWSFAEIFRG